MSVLLQTIRSIYAELYMIYCCTKNESGITVIEFLNRLFVDGEYTFKKKVEPPYINRNWILHGRSCRLIERYECIQLFNALSVIEFVFSIDKS